MGTLTRQEMEAVIKRGGSVLYQGQVLSRIEDLPSKAQLAKGDPQAEQVAAQELQAQMAELQRQMAQLQQPQGGTFQVSSGGQTSAPLAHNATSEQVNTAINNLDIWAQLALTGKQGEALQAAGYGDVAALRAASDDELLAVEGIGKSTVEKIREATKE